MGGRAAGVIAVAIAAGCAGGVGQDSRDGTASQAAVASTGSTSTGGDSSSSSSSSTTIVELPTTSSSSSTTSGSSSGESTGSSSSSSSESEGGGPACGDAVVDADEACDDGNTIDGDGCNADCEPSGKLLWSTRYSGGIKMSDEALGCAVDEFGAIYVTGFSLITKLDEDIWTRSYAADGAVLWTQTHGGAIAGKDRGTALVVDGSQLAYVAGYESVDMQGPDVWLRKLAADGGPVWTRGYNGPTSGSDALYGATMTPEGDLVVAGQHAAVDQGLDIWLRKYDPAGATLWTRTYAGAAGKNDIARSVVTTADGYIYVAGQESVANEGYNAWLGHFDADGNLLWSRLYAGAASLDDILFGVAASADGGVVACGVETSVAVPALSFVRKYDADGLVVWTHSDDGDGHLGAYCNAVDVTADGDVVLAGSAIDGGLQRPRVQRLDADGAALWSTLIVGAGTGSSQARCVHPAPDGTLVVAGGLDDGEDGRDGWVGRLSP